MLSDVQIRRLVTRQQQRIAALGESQGRTAARLFAELGSYTPDDIDEWVRLVTPTMNATRTTATRIGTATYSTIFQVRPPTVGVPDIPDELREPFIAYWRALNAGHPEAEALVSGTSRAEAIVRNAAVSTSRRTGDSVARATGNDTQWRRMTDGKACSWCIDLTSPVWPTAEAADFGHDRCGCTPIPA